MKTKKTTWELEQLLDEAYNLLDILNEKARIPQTFNLYWFELGYNFETSLLSKLGKKHEWRASLYFGNNFDDIDMQMNYFGFTPKSAIRKMIKEIKKLK